MHTKWFSNKRRKTMFDWLLGDPPDRIYKDGRHEWHQPLDGGWKRVVGNDGSIEFEREFDNGWFKRGDNFGQDFDTHIRWSDGAWERKWDR
jgi:hypothetical protein